MRWLATWFLKKSQVSVVAWRLCSTVFRCLESAEPASCVRTVQKSGMSGAKGTLSSLLSMLSTRLQSSDAASPRTPSAGSARQPRRSCWDWPALATRTCQMETVISFTAQRQSERTPLSLLASATVRISMGMSSGHSGALAGRWSSTMSMIWLPRLCTQSATFRRTCGCGSASSTRSRPARTSAWPAAPSPAHTEPSSRALLRHCRRSTAPCSRAGCHTSAACSTWKRPATVAAGCCALASP
mmetsp:Transcript_14148/g.40152  ORF Transcript_14148/g.40152 Transcript_14148/m.40152 type:complete len:242 (+) Transcript_14148:2662-3387(+)